MGVSALPMRNGSFFRQLVASLMSREETRVRGERRLSHESDVDPVAGTRDVVAEYPCVADTTN